MDATETYAHFALENDTGGTYRRWAFISAGGKAFVQYADDTGWYYPQDLINPVKTNTWYVAILRADDINGFSIDMHERDNPSVSGTYTRPMPTGLSWRFHHWIWRNTSYLANYVERKVNGGTTVYVGNLFEKNTTTGEVTKYYYAEGRRIAMRKGTGSPSYLLSDHLGGTVGVVDANGSLKDGYYFAYGGQRNSAANSVTDKLFTGQQLDQTGLYFYGTRFYDPVLGRFLSPDSMVPAPGNPQALNRYAYTLNNPLKYNDPDGHWVHILAGAAAGAAIAYGVQVVGNVHDNGLSVQAFTNVDVRTIGAGAVAGAVGAATLGLGTAAIAGAELTGSAATAATGATLAGSGVAAGQASRAVMGEQLGRPEDMALDAASAVVGGVAGEAVLGRVASAASKAGMRYGPTNPGPLDEIVANSFRSSSYTERVLSKATTMYRVISDDGNPAGSYWTTVKPAGPLQATIDLALDPAFGNSATRVIEARIPAGTTIYEGFAGEISKNTYYLQGGGTQVYIPQVDPAWIVQ
ncbi:MAG: RHS repeat-associated core domain-containing protein [Chloroflexi bacterium]|nr:RHS repeat-associated core domain-containing protein [Chloroflexota bacterium]